MAPNDSANPIGTEPTVHINWDDDGMHLVIQGAITADHLIVAAHHLERTADGIIDAMARLAESQQPRLAIARAMPGATGMPNGG